MLVDNKFYYISLPRCASTAFHISCLKQNISVQTMNDVVDTHYKNIDVLNISIEELLHNRAPHMHEKLTDLENKFGNTFDIISVKRNKHERFYSLWKHVLNEIRKYNGDEVYDKLKVLSIKDILYFPFNSNLQDFEIVSNLAKDFLDKLDVNYDWYTKNCIVNMYTPTSVWHNNDPRIKWFDFDKLYELEEWVCKKIEKPFLLQNMNSSSNVECYLKLDKELIKYYNSIFDRYDIQKSEKSII